MCLKLVQVKFFLPISVFFIMIFGCLSLNAEEQSFIAKKASKALVLDISQLPSNTLFAVGERGHILSSSNWEDWAQAKVPTKQTLTGVDFVNDEKGWVVGHDAIILATQNGGKTWLIQYVAPEKEQPLFDVIFKDENNGIAIGAYGLYLVTNDGGNTWQEKYIESLDDETYGLPHFYKINRFTGKIYYMAGEAGLVARSEDGGDTWSRIATPYQGSFFNMFITNKNSILVMGLRGNMLRSDDAGKSWDSVTTNTIAGLNAATHLPDGSILVSGMEGVFLHSKDDGKTFTLTQHPDRLDYSTLVIKNKEQFLAAGESGLDLLDLKSIH